MIRRMFVAVIFLEVFTAVFAFAQDEVETSFSGRVLADGRAVNWSLEVRLEREDTSLIDTRHTLGSDTFKFSPIMLKKYEKSYLVIREPGYKELRYPISLDDFSVAKSIYGDERYFLRTIYILNIEKLPTDGTDQASPRGPKTVGVDQILPKNAQKEYDLVAKSFASGDSQAALKHLEKVVELAPKNLEAVSRLGAEYFKAGQLEKAETMLNRARTLDPKDLPILTNLGALYLQQGDKLASSAGADKGADAGRALYQKAADVLEEALLIDAKEPRTNFYLGTALYKIGEDERAESLLNTSLALDPQMQDVRLTLLNIYVRQKDYDAALEQIELYLEANPNSPQRERLEKYKLQIENALKQEE
jgi:Flp pilus assembly protein TadD